MYQAQSFQQPLDKECTLNYDKNPYMIYGLFLNSGLLEALEAQLLRVVHALFGHVRLGLLGVYPGGA